MSFTDPLSITYLGGPISLPRTDSGEENAGEYTSGDGLHRITASHQYGGKNGRARRMLRFDTGKLTTDPFKPAENVKVTMSNYIVFDTPAAGYTVAEQLAAYVAFKGFYTATSDAIITKLLGGES